MQNAEKRDKIPELIKMIFSKKIILIAMLLLPSIAFSQDKISVKGTVTDQNGEPVIGAVVSVVGSTNGTATDENGYYTIQTAANSILRFSCLTYETKEIEVNNQTLVNVVLEETDVALSDVVVIGYGTQRKIDITGAVTSVSNDVTKDRVVMDIGQALAGKAAGLVVRQDNGSPGQIASINIRGNTSLNSSSPPLYIIDGVVSSGRDVIPSQIETIDILKDAASTAIYGSQGANGVILITTKQGKTSTNRVEFYGMWGSQNVSRTLRLLNSAQLKGREYWANSYYVPDGDLSGGAFPGQNQPIPGQGMKLPFMDDEGNLIYMNYFDNGSVYYWGQQQYMSNTDWQKELYDTALLQDYRVTLSGGSKTNSYSIMAGHKNQDGILYGSSYKDYSLRGNFRQEISKKAHVSLNLSYLSFEQDVSEIADEAVMTSPMMATDQGIGYVEKTIPESVPSLWSDNPLDMERYTKYMNYNEVFTLNGVFEYNFMPGLNLYLSASYSNNTWEEQRWIPRLLKRGFYEFDSYVNNSVAANRTNTSKNLRSENTLSYNKRINDHEFTVMGGNTIYSNKQTLRFAGAADFPSDNLGVHGMHEGLIQMKPEYKHVKMNGVSYFGRLNYSLKDRYLFQSTLRADGSSVFAENNKWGYFPSVASGWRILEEKWMEPAKSFMSNLKLRASWGNSGKQAISPYQSLATATFQNTTIDGTDFVSALYFNNIGNSDLKWETTEEWNLGLDLGFLNEKIVFTVDAYIRTTKDLLYNDPLPSWTGYSSQIRNIGKIENRGLEFSVFANPIKTKDWDWNMNFNISANRGKVLKLGIKDDKIISLGQYSTGGYLKEGQPLGQFYGNIVEGIWQNQAEIDAENALLAEGKNRYATYMVRPGFEKFVDLNNDGRITNEDKTVIGNGMPKFTGGFTNTLSWKDLTLNFTMQYSIGNKVYNGTKARLHGIHYVSGQALEEVVTDSWSPNYYHWDPVTGQRGEIYRAGNLNGTIPIQLTERTTHYGAWVPHSNYLEDGSYLRLADITLTYNIPDRFINKAKISDARIFFSASNLFVITGYEGYDPEVNNSSGEASYLVPGLDFHVYPKSRTFSMGVSLTF